MRLLAKATFVLSLLALVLGCDSVIERTEPSTAVSQDVALSNPDAIQGVRARMYDELHDPDMSTDWLLGASALVDDTYGRAGEERHRGLNENVQGAHLGAYGDTYDLINQANLLVSGIESGALSEERLNRLEAEGRFMRALAMHHAVRIWGYEPGMTPNSGPGQGWDLGIELRTEPTLDVSDAEPVPRSPVSDVYDQIVTDLNEATSLFSQLPGDVKEGSEFFASEASAQALLARVHLYQRNWSGAETAATEAINLAGSQFGSALATPSQVRAKQIFDETTNNPEAIFTIDTDPATESAGVNNALAAYTSNEWMAQIPTQDLLNAYESGDARYEGWFGDCFNDTRNEDTDCTGINDEDLELQKYTSEQGGDPYADDYVHLRVGEMVLIQAEARLQTQSRSAAIGRLNDLRRQRDVPELSPGDFSTDEEVMDAIMEERRRELVAEGHRFFDFKRLGRDIPKAPGTPEPAFIPFEDIRILDNYPNGQVQQYEVLVQNPGY